jgi:hypothetical protein
MAADSEMQSHATWIPPAPAAILLFLLRVFMHVDLVSVSRSRARYSMRSGSLAAIAAPDPDEGVGQSLFEDAAVAVARGEAEDVGVIVAFGLERSGGALKAMTQL